MSPEQVKFASTVHSAGQDLLALINEILDLSKVEAGKMPVNPKAVEISEVQEYLEQTFRPVAEHKNLEFVVELQKPLPEALFTDESRLHQILKNLLSNAFKFTEKGEVKLHISQVQREGIGSSKNTIVFAVHDTGIGIPGDKQKLIFEAFQQADGTTSRKYGGTGLGLTISREIARLLGGWIEVESEAGRGSRFTLILPEKYSGPESSMGGAEPLVLAPPLPYNADFTGRKVLIVDDDVRNVFALSSVLKLKGMNIIYAENGRQGIQALKENQNVDLVLMDTMMPEMDGLEATREIRSIAQFGKLPIIALTAKAMKGDREKCLEAGASDYVTKPVDEDHLLAIMYDWLSKPELLT